MAERGTGAVAVEGLAELQRAFSRLSKDLGGGVREALEASGEPVRSEASRLALQEISGMKRSKLPWWRMRTGVTRHSIYVAPEERGRFTKRNPRRYARDKIADRMLDEAMIPALEKNQARAVHEMGAQLDELFRAWERV